MVTASLIELEIDIDIVDSGELGLSGVLRVMVGMREWR